MKFFFGCQLKSEHWVLSVCDFRLITMPKHSLPNYPVSLCHELWQLQKKGELCDLLLVGHDGIIQVSVLCLWYILSLAFEFHGH